MKKIKGFYIIFLIIILWFIVCKLNIFSSYILPSPKMVFKSFLDLCKNGSLVSDVLISLFRVFLGFFLSALLAIPLGVLFGVKPKLYDYFKTLFEFLRNTPPLALIPMLILWFGIGETSKIIVIILASFFPIFLNTLDGIKNCDKKLIEVGLAFKLSKEDLLRKIIFPSSISNILVGLRLGLGYSFRAIIGAEMIASSSGLGYLILNAKALSRSSEVIVGIIVIGLLGIITDFLFKIISKKLTKKFGGNTYEFK